jgi:putative membrane protein
VIDLVIKVLINAVGVLVAVLVIPQIEFAAANNWFEFRPDWWKLPVVALILALVNTYVKPLVKLMSLPVTILSLGLFTFILNALLLLLVAFISDQLALGFTIGGFPPSFTSDSFIGALLGSIVISVVSMLLGMVNTGRKVVV